MHNPDTIVAEATPRGRGGVGVVRLSGPKTVEIAERLLGRVPTIRQAEHLSFLDDQGACIDQGIALFFKAPYSFTGEDVLELQGHGGPVIMDTLVQAAVKAGARLAEPGEFSLRAFLNNKIDLLQAEAIADLINAHSQAAAKSALRSLQGVFSCLVQDLARDIMHLRVYVEAAIDFPEEEIDFLQDQKILGDLKKLLNQLENISAQARQGVLLSEGLRVVLTGRPNAGKSSLLNLLSGQDSAIVTEIPGTTRDVLREQISIEGLLIHLIDTAGLRKSVDAIEQEGIVRALKEISLADHVLLVVDATQTSESDPEKLYAEYSREFLEGSISGAGVEITVLYNKIDQLTQSPLVQTKKSNNQIYTLIPVSVKTGEGISIFKNHLKKVLGFSENTEGNFMARRRHLESLSEAKRHLSVGGMQLRDSKAGELLAEELRLAQLALDSITGKVSSDDLLGEIFSEFCVGK